MMITKKQLMIIIKESLKDITPDQKRATAIEAGYFTLQPSIAPFLGLPAIVTGPYIPQDTMRKEDEIVDVYHDPDNLPVPLDKEEELDLDAIDLYDADLKNISSGLDLDLNINPNGV